MGDPDAGGDAHAAVGRTGQDHAGSDLGQPVFERVDAPEVSWGVLRHATRPAGDPHRRWLGSQPNVVVQVGQDGVDEWAIVGWDWRDPDGTPAGL